MLLLVMQESFHQSRFVQNLYWTLESLFSNGLVSRNYWELPSDLCFHISNR